VGFHHSYLLKLNRIFAGYQPAISWDSLSAGFYLLSGSRTDCESIPERAKQAKWSLAPRDATFPLVGVHRPDQIVAFLNIGFFYSRMGKEGGCQDPEFYTLPREFVQKHHYRPESGFEYVGTKHLDLSPYKDELGFEQIARDLNIPYPKRSV